MKYYTTLQKCPACGHSHELVHDGDYAPTGRFSFICRATQKQVMIPQGTRSMIWENQVETIPLIGPPPKDIAFPTPPDDAIPVHIE